MKKVVVTGLMLIFVAFSVFGDTVVLKDGRKFIGEIIEETEQFVKIKTEEGKVLRIKRSAIMEMSKETAEVEEEVSSYSGIIVLKDGRKFAGEIIEETEQFVKIKTEKGKVLRIKRSAIAEITRGTQVVTAEEERLAIVQGSARQKRREPKAKGWGYISLIDLLSSYPFAPSTPSPVFLRVAMLEGGIGFAPPKGLGIRTALVEASVPWGEDEEAIGGFFPIYLFYIPYGKVKREDRYSWLVHTYFGGAPWGSAESTPFFGGAPFYRAAIGFQWADITIPWRNQQELHFAYGGFELGWRYVQFEKRNTRASSFYVGAIFAPASRWFAFGKEQPSSSEGILLGLIVDEESRKPLAATITFPGTEIPSIVSDPTTGIYKLTISAGAIRIHVVKEGYRETRRAAIVKGGDTQVIDFSLQRKVMAKENITGTITDILTGATLKATINFSETDLPPVWSDLWTGIYKAYLPPGTYVARISAEGYITQSRSIVINKDLTTKQDFALLKKGHSLDR